jgi:hypothetical protein
VPGRWKARGAGACKPLTHCVHPASIRHQDIQRVAKSVAHPTPMTRNSHAFYR